MQQFPAGMSHQVKVHIIGSQMCLGCIFSMNETFTLKTTHIAKKEFLNI
jgi:hypothetical protein